MRYIGDLNFSGMPQDVYDRAREWKGIVEEGDHGAIVQLEDDYPWFRLRVLGNDASVVMRLIKGAAAYVYGVPQE